MTPNPQTAINLTFLPWQYDFFFRRQARVKLIHKGRRLGLTQGAAYYLIVSMLQGRYKKVLWGDTVASNIDKYVERYFLPFLRKISSACFKWRKQDRCLQLSDGTIDFRSADRPENWEGFGYDFVFLNEAGIILRNSYLWDNAVRPMLLDNPASEAIVGGTPKGMWHRGAKHKFWELVEQGYDDDRTLIVQHSTYDNPLLSREEIKRMEKEMPESVVRQEIYGEFLDIDESVLISMAVVRRAAERLPPPFETVRAVNPLIMGIDVGWAVDPTGWAVRCGNLIHDYGFVRPRRSDLATVDELVAVINHYNPDYLVLDQGYATGVESMLIQRGYDPILVPFGAKAQAKDRYMNKRVEMYDRLRMALEQDLCIPDEVGLHTALSSMGLVASARGVMQLEPKEAIKERLGDNAKWLNVADAIALTYAHEWGPRHRRRGKVIKSIENIDH